LARARVADLRVRAKASLVAQARDVADEPFAGVAVGDRCAHRRVREAWAQRPVFDDVDLELQAVALQRGGEPLPRLVELGVGGGPLAEQLAHVRGRVERGARGLAVDLGLTALLVLGLRGEAGGDRVGVALNPVVGVAAGCHEAGELELDALDVRPAAVDLAAQGGRNVDEALALGALAPSESLCLFGELVGAVGFPGRELAVLGELVLQAQSLRGGRGVERVERRSAGGDRLLDPIVGEARGACARVFDQRFDCPRARSPSAVR
jgi:hypothetical protein